MNFVQKHTIIYTFIAWEALQCNLCSFVCMCIYLYLYKWIWVGPRWEAIQCVFAHSCWVPTEQQGGCILVFLCICICVFVCMCMSGPCSLFLLIHAGFPLSNKADGSHFVNSRHPDINLSLEHQHLSWSCIRPFGDYTLAFIYAECSRIVHSNNLSCPCVKTCLYVTNLLTMVLVKSCFVGDFICWQTFLNVPTLERRRPPCNSSSKRDNAAKAGASFNPFHGQGLFSGWRLNYLTIQESLETLKSCIR